MQYKAAPKKARWKNAKANHLSSLILAKYKELLSWEGTLIAKRIEKAKGGVADIEEFVARYKQHKERT